MIIGDEKFAAALKDSDGKVVKFDDIGCWKVYEKKHSSEGGNAWVHDYKSGEWIESGRAFFVYSGRIVSPMRYGLAAFSLIADAEDFAKQSAGQILKPQELEKVIQSISQKREGNPNE